MYAAKEASVWKRAWLQAAINSLVVWGCDFKALTGVCTSMQLAFVCHFPLDVNIKAVIKVAPVG